MGIPASTIIMSMTGTNKTVHQNAVARDVKAYRLRMRLMIHGLISPTHRALHSKTISLMFMVT